MLKQLVLRNWRSVREATINFTPITVFIGANSSGKSNILDALHFVRQVTDSYVSQALHAHGWFHEIITRNTGATSFEIGFSYKPVSENKELTYSLSCDGRGSGLDAPYSYSERLTDDSDRVFLNLNNQHYEVAGEQGDLVFDETGLKSFGRISSYPELQQTYAFITRRWQLLTEGFSAETSIADNRRAFYTYSSSPLTQRISQLGDNTLMLLEQIQRYDQRRKPKDRLFPKLQEQFAWLMSHVERFDVKTSDIETELQIIEKTNDKEIAATVSYGTRRMLAVLAAYYILDVSTPQMPGVVVVEEPDAALNPLAVGKFIDLLHDYVDRDEKRQFILTTHNPQLLDYLKPEEVRVVERDPETGETSVNTVPDDIKEIWLKKHTLGDAWISRIIGGIPEL